MKEISDKFSFDQAKHVDLVDLLSRHGHEPTKIRGNDYWYLSPLRIEKTASFKINRAKNIWYDHGIGKGGNSVDFAVLFFNCSVADALHKLDENPAFHQPLIYNQMEKPSLIRITGESSIKSLSLLKYLIERRISERIAAKYCREVNFEIHNKQYTAIGFKNNKGGYELRNSWFKGSSAPKGMTSFENGSKEGFVFEGFFDFLSFQTINKNQPHSGDYLILNSTSFFEEGKAWMDAHDTNHLFLDNDSTGKKLAAIALSRGSKYRDESHLYEGYKDLNEWTQQMGKRISKRLKH